MNIEMIMSIIILIGLAFVFFCIFIYAKMKTNEMRGINSKEKIEISEIIHTAIPDGSQYTPLYAYQYNDTKHSKSYRHYAIGFIDKQLYAFELSFEGKEIVYGTPLLIEKQNLGRIGAVYNEGSIHYVSFFDKNDNELLSIWVEQSNTRWNKAAHFNIQQKAEAESFMQTVYQWMAEINHNVPKKIMGFGIN